LLAGLVRINRSSLHRQPPGPNCPPGRATRSARPGRGAQSGSRRTAQMRRGHQRDG
jgi:hypothetical protein